MYQLFERHFSNVVQLKQEFLQSTWETLYMVSWTASIAGVLGVLLGIVFVNTDLGGVSENSPLYSVLEKIINVYCSILFIIMLALTRLLIRISVGAIAGITTALVPLVIGVILFLVYQIKNTLLEMDPGITEAVEAMGTSPLGIILRVCLIEGPPGIIHVSAVTIINLIGLTTMAGTIGIGGLGDLVIIRGCNRLQTDMILTAALIILIMVSISQAVNNQLVKRTLH